MLSTLFKQTGFQFAHPSPDEAIAILHGTVVYHRIGRDITFRSGGWITRATAKAMRGAITMDGLEDALQVQLSNGRILVRLRQEILRDACTTLKLTL